MDQHLIGLRIKQRRKELGLTQTQIKEQTGISSGNMSEIENGSKLPSALTLIQLSNILNCSTDWILKGDSPNCEIFFLSEEEKQLLTSFKKLSDIDKEELLDILFLKLNRMQKTKKRIQ